MSVSNHFTYDPAQVVTLEAALDLPHTKPLGQNSNDDGQARALAYPDFTYRHVWGDLRGWVRLNLTSSVIRKTTNVFASISEADPIVTSTDPIPAPFLGAAVMTVANIAPYNGGVQVLVSVSWDAPLFTVVSYVFVNP
ncbi:hypothetical protein ACPW96_00055 [Micromonospora sp. DT81.3]|uniref:hypothetical protein n=1 Tax=Micromonospora sp. DT81.3 TaxID=3416523 RepID=UPI003CF99784